MKNFIKHTGLLLFTFLFVTLNLIAQNQKNTVVGIVKDDNNKKITDAVFYFDDVKTNFKTDKSGKFKLKVDPSTKIIKAFSFSRGVVEMEYTGQKKMDFIFINQFKLEKKPNTKSRKDNYAYNSIYDMIRSRVPGVRIEGTKIIIRGETSLQGSVEPLLVVDGTPVSSIDNIVPDFVKSITVLKGPETAAYGVRGSNGVILIQMKNK